MKVESIQAAKSAYDIEAQCIQEMKNYFDEVAFARAVHLLAQAPRIGAAGCGHSGIICQHFAHLMCCIERPARFISPAEAVHGATGFLQKGDVMVFASRGGKTKELLPIVDICKAKGVSIITVTENLESPLAQAADVVLMDDKPSNISRAIRVARKTMTIVWQNIIFALGIKLLILVLAAFGIANMWLAVFGDVGVAIIAILNAMRAMGVKNL